MKILLTGGLGFLGGATTEALLARGDEVAVIDDCSYGEAKNLPKGAGFVKMSAKDLPQYYGDEPSYRPELIYHFGSKSSILHYFKDPIETAYDTIAGWRGVLLYQHQTGARLIAMSSATVYGTAPLPQKEDGPTQPINTYSILKLGCERMTEGTDAVLVRLFTGYGPGEMNKTWYKSPIGMFLEAAKQKKPYVIFGDGTQTRDFVYIDDVVKSLLILGDGEFIGPINICTGKETSMNRLVDIVADITGKDYGRTTSPKFPRYVDHMRGDDTLFRKVVGITPISIEEGVGRFYARASET